jgi:hypothetical protein
VPHDAFRQPSPSARLSQAVSSCFKPARNRHPIDTIDEISTCSLFHRFGGMLPVRSWRELATPKNSAEPIPENRETVKQMAFYLAISITCLFQSGLKQLAISTAQRRWPPYAEQ